MYNFSLGSSCCFTEAPYDSPPSFRGERPEVGKAVTPGSETSPPPHSRVSLESPREACFWPLLEIGASLYTAQTLFPSAVTAFTSCPGCLYYKGITSDTYRSDLCMAASTATRLTARLWIHYLATLVLPTFSSSTLAIPRVITPLDTCERESLGDQQRRTRRVPVLPVLQRQGYSYFNARVTTASTPLMGVVFQ